MDDLTASGATPELWLLTGMSGAGRTTALDALRRAGVACTDDLPPALLPAFAATPRTEPAVVAIDARRGAEVSRLTPPPGTHVLFLDADDRTLVRRLADSTTPHPCAVAGTGRPAVIAERELLGGLRGQAEVVLETTDLQAADLGRRVVDIIRPLGRPARQLVLTVSSFGFKFGPPVDADWVADVRFLPNPFWVPELRPLTGLDGRVAAHVLGTAAGPELVRRLAELMDWVAGLAEQHGRRRLNLAVGCTGGRHRSVAIACAVAARLNGGGREVAVRHRDVERSDPR